MLFIRHNSAYLQYIYISLTYMLDSFSWMKRDILYCICTVVSKVLSSCTDLRSAMYVQHKNRNGLTGKQKTRWRRDRTGRAFPLGIMRIWNWFVIVRQRGTQNAERMKVNRTGEKMHTNKKKLKRKNWTRKSERMKEKQERSIFLIDGKFMVNNNNQEC